ncbi:MAG TPA: LytR C-terminal domain-containing protein [Acidimicrobiales bacterium]|jgi:hypothetical protein
MVRRGRHAAEDGSFNRSASTAVGRGILLLLVAFVIGIALLQQVDDPVGEQQVSSSSDEETTTTLPAVVEPPTTTAAPVREPKNVRVLTANGTSVKGAGGRIKDRVLAGGYNALAATDTKTPATASVVFFTPGYEREAAALATLLGLQPTAVQAMPTPPPVADLKAANLLVVVGPDLAQAPAGSSTSTTARTGATTSSTARSGATTSSSTTTTVKR